MGILGKDVVGTQNHGTTSPQLAQLLENLIQHLPIRTAIWHLEDPEDPTSFRLMFVNYSSSALHSTIDMRAEVGRRILEIYPNSLPTGLLQRYVEVLGSGQTSSLGEVPLSDERLGDVVLSMQAIPLSREHLCISVEDVTERKRAEESQRQAAVQEDMIRVQQAMLAELSTPLIPLSEQVVVMPLVGAVDSSRAQQVLETLLQGIASSGARVAILDITGVPVVDTQVANALIRAAQAVKLLGANVVLTGIRPEVAQTLVGLGTDLSGIVTRSNLQSGIAYAIGSN
jgi:anti-anti-sigma regulatory factor